MWETPLYSGLKNLEAVGIRHTDGDIECGVALYIPALGAFASCLFLMRRTMRRVLVNFVWPPPFHLRWTLKGARWRGGELPVVLHALPEDSLLSGGVVRRECVFTFLHIATLGTRFRLCLLIYLTRLLFVILNKRDKYEPRSPQWGYFVHVHSLEWFYFLHLHRRIFYPIPTF